ncbi:hypothetical protein HYH03_012384 [Edaphochlamys debaryana]|uniref:AB hydrolase-1 domain-containing protein n=1 Tax=Edaphochlamys debaryana TaxID=47281 RepID=A0A835XUB0_9CHLO|nr:hypothetical protein HYH03_012384 [Edaphochlamys debaryana]|eukprot:KAG2489158.1 hypothetical protein HYH03_012384 [Edaphochlamys debaryana]
MNAEGTEMWRPAQAAVRHLRRETVGLDSNLAFEIVQGSDVQWSGVQDSAAAPPTAVLVHGILGHKTNLSSFAELLVRRNPDWQVVLADLRCHGESASLPSRPQGPHGVQEAAHDLLQLLRQLRLFPRVLIGHSFGGKVVMSMVQQFSAKLPRPVQVWVLDTLPGPLAGRAAGGRGGGGPNDDSPERLIEVLRAVPMPAPNRQTVIDHVLTAGFSLPIARWVATNLRRAPDAPPLSFDQVGGGLYTYYEGGGPLTWTFDLEGIAEMYRSYEASQQWDLVTRPPEGLSLDFVRAERSAYHWGTDINKIRSAGHGVYLLPASGHWVAADNAAGLYDLIAPSLQLAPSPRRRFQEEAYAA